MGFFARLLAMFRQPQRSAYDDGFDPYGQGRYDDRYEDDLSGGRPEDEQAIERYRYLLRTAPPDQIEEAHAEAFAMLTPEQRQQVLLQLGDEVPPGERVDSDDPRALARMATRAEMRQPGTLERTLGPPGGMGYGYGGYGVGGVGMGGVGMGGMFAGSLLGSIAGAFVGTAMAGVMFDSLLGDAGTDVMGSPDDAAGGGGDYGSGDGGDYGGDGGDWGSGDWGGGGGDWGGGGGDWGGDFGGDFGGGDF